MKLYRMVLLGPPASGKGTQGRWITEHWGIPVTSVGDVLRREKEARTPLGLEAASYIDHGNLVPDRVALSSIESWLAANEAAFMFDGFPRTLGQAKALDTMLNQHHAPLMAVLWLEVDAETIRERVSRRLVCAKCGHTFSLGWQVHNRTDACPNCGGHLETRHDDSAETLVHRMSQYEEHTAPLIEYYEARGLLRRIDAARAPEKVSAQIEAVFDSLDSTTRLPRQKEVATR